MKFQKSPCLSVSALACLFTISFLFGCKKSNSSSSSSTGISATINGSAWQSNSSISGDDRTFNYLSIDGYRVTATDSSSLTLFFPDSVKVNEVLSIANNSDFQINYYPNLGTNVTYTASYIYGTTASITITSIDTSGHKVSGTFSGTLPLVNGNSNVDSVVITNGHFNSSYIIQ